MFVLLAIGDVGYVWDIFARDCKGMYILLFYTRQDMHDKFAQLL